ncbi:unnamed protein product [Protopolystoma xenopodis]|uniref:Uncharacterized protein n=1 Tax=Protopolystoma xenopodis TaxID=117903 RepID=A0A448WKA6_9PLAT|nr:unnamed protein product [Protopolystoma xenopodis]
MLADDNEAGKEECLFVLCMPFNGSHLATLCHGAMSSSGTLSDRQRQVFLPSNCIDFVVDISVGGTRVAEGVVYAWLPYPLPQTRMACVLSRSEGSDSKSHDHVGESGQNGVQDELWRVYFTPIGQEVINEFSLRYGIEGIFQAMTLSQP